MELVDQMLSGDVRQDLLHRGMGLLEDIGALVGDGICRGIASRSHQAGPPAATGGPSPPGPPDDDDDGDEDDEEELSDDDDDDRRRNRRSSRRRRSRDRRDHDSGRPRISRKEAERVNVPAWPKITKLDSWKMALNHEGHQRFSRP